MPPDEGVTATPPSPTAGPGAPTLPGLGTCPPRCDSEADSPQFDISDLGWFRRPFVGRLYLSLTDGTVGGWCTGTLVAVDVVLTAAHCVYPGFLGGDSVFDHVQSMAFLPDQWGEEAPFGSFVARSGTVYQEYVDAVKGGSDAGFPPLDYAFIDLDPNLGGQDAGDVAGGWYGIVVNYVSDMFSMGYPAGGAFFSRWHGNYPYYCASPYGAYSTWAASKTFYDIAIGCTMTGGSSGGPWFTSYLGGWDYVASVNSHGYTGVPTENMWGPYFTRKTIDLLDAAGSG